jgi:hypothetical protein
VLLLCALPRSLIYDTGQVPAHLGECQLDLAYSSVLKLDLAL